MIGGKAPVSGGSTNASKKRKLGGAIGPATVKKTRKPMPVPVPVHTPIHCLRCGALDAHSTPNCDFAGTDAEAKLHKTKGKKERDKKRAEKRAKKRAERKKAKNSAVTAGNTAGGGSTDTIFDILQNAGVFQNQPGSTVSTGATQPKPFVFGQSDSTPRGTVGQPVQPDSTTTQPGSTFLQPSGTVSHDATATQLVRPNGAVVQPAIQPGSTIQPDSTAPQPCSTVILRGLQNPTHRDPKKPIPAGFTWGNNTFEGFDTPSDTDTAMAVLTMQSNICMQRAAAARTTKSDTALLTISEGNEDPDSDSQEDSEMAALMEKEASTQQNPLSATSEVANHMVSQARVIVEARPTEDPEQSCDQLRRGAEALTTGTSTLPSAAILNSRDDTGSPKNGEGSVASPAVGPPHLEGALVERCLVEVQKRIEEEV
eukprot:SAG11_NODE_2376_length_3440_cov_2.320862_2_plen_427_part_00